MNNETTRYQVRYFLIGKPANHGGLCDLARALYSVKFLKRRGMTAWVVDDAGTFVPVVGAKRNPVAA
jgi:hypothetical protein